MIKIYALPTLAPCVKAGLLLLCLSFSSVLFAQQKQEFGFVVKAGIHTLPTTKTDLASYYSTKISKAKAGSTYILGIWQSIPLGGHFRLSGELLYRHASFSFSDQYSALYWEGSYHSVEHRDVKENSFVLPVKLHFSFKKGGKSSIAVGGGLTHFFAASVFSQSRTQYEPFPESTSIDTYRYHNENIFNHQWSLSAGFYYKLNTMTSLGLEYNFEQPTDSYYPNVYFPLNPLIDIAYNIPLERPVINSFTLSLRHNIL